ncbi:FAD/NAD(P)-binding oxidoreductase [Arthrobacter sp. Br18]|uniref:NAD(P)/FAD-dependent oxidoreductase n=1 Tax=Arthrobacter sp. Br18 TaxID=1312954 RepID=UPI000479F729|nr:FAD/NAD(P)-binding oxidoreductase [Arthrobacter sp. Br18]
MTTPLPATHHSDVVILGGGNAGISLAARLRRYGVKDVAVVEPREHHLYQPLFSHIAGGTAPAKMATRPQADVIPKGVTWIRDAAAAIDTGTDTVMLASGARATYGHLVVCPGIQKDWDAVPGLAEAMASPSGASNYEFELAPKAWELLRNLRKGTVVFTQPAGPATCSGASQKPMYLACDYWRGQGVLEDIRVVLVVPTPTVFGMPLIDAELNRKIAEYGIELHCSSELAEVDAGSRTAVVRSTLTGGTENIPYDVLHAVPPQSAPDWLKATSLPAPEDADGFVEVDPQTLRHPRYGNVWSLGDAAATRNSKSGAALRMQTAVLARNLVAVRKGKKPRRKYNSYSACPFTVSRGTVVFSEFDDKYRAKPTIPLWKGLAKERRLTWFADRVLLPRVYWYLILKGRA